MSSTEWEAKSYLTDNVINNSHNCGVKRVRLYENMHILLWLVKDTCWLMHYKWAGTFMIFPTLTMALYLTWITRKQSLQLLPNLAVTCWISANITWMVGEFYGHDLTIPALVFFVSGICIMMWYFWMINIIQKRPN